MLGPISGLVTYESSSFAVTVDLSTSRADGQGSDRMVDVENIDGKAGVDACDGAGGSDVFISCP